MVKVNLYAKDRGPLSYSLAMSAPTDTHTHTNQHTHMTDDVTSSANAGGNNPIITRGGGMESTTGLTLISESKLPIIDCE